jgi:uncharacterized protein
MKAILLHGKDKSSKDIWYSWLVTELNANGISCVAPDLPNADNPKINEWLSVIDGLDPDEDTILIGHSRGGMAVLRWLETRKQRVTKVVLVAANSADIVDNTGGDFYSGPYNFADIKNYCREFVVIHSRDDSWVSYTAGIENAVGLDAKLVTLENRNHFGSQADGTIMKTFPELLDAILN